MTPTDDLQHEGQCPRMPFGKHQGKFLTEIPADYLIWLEENMQNMDPDFRAAVNKAIDIQHGDLTSVGW